MACCLLWRWTFGYRKGSETDPKRGKLVQNQIMLPIQKLNVYVCMCFARLCWVVCMWFMYKMKMQFWAQRCYGYCSVDLFLFFFLPQRSGLTILQKWLYVPTFYTPSSSFLHIMQVEFCAFWNSLYKVIKLNHAKESHSNDLSFKSNHIKSTKVHQRKCFLSTFGLLKNYEGNDFRTFVKRSFSSLFSSLM